MRGLGACRTRAGEGRGLGGVALGLGKGRVWGVSH